MSLLQVADVAVTLDGLSDTQKQTLIDRAESFVAGLMGRSVRNLAQSAGSLVVPSDDEGEIITGGVVTQDTNGDPDFDNDTADRSALGAALEEIDLYFEREKRILELPVGPVLIVRDVEVNGDSTTTFTDFDWAPWSVKWRDTRKRFGSGSQFTATVITGFTRERLPDRVKQAVLSSIDLIRSNHAASGELSNPAQRSERIGPATFSYGERASEADQTSAAFSAEKQITEMLGPWVNPALLF